MNVFLLFSTLYYLRQSPYLPIFTFPSPHASSSLKVYAQITIILMVCVSQLLFVAINMDDDDICHTRDVDYISPQLWLILFASTEITLLAVNLVCDCCCTNVVIVISSWALALSYALLIFIGTNITWYQCFLGDHVIGPCFVVFSLFSGVIISFMNVNLIDLMYHKRVKSGMHAVVDVYEELCV